MLAQYDDNMRKTKQIFMPEQTEPKRKSGSTIRIYRDGKPVDIPVEEFLRMLKEANV